MALSRASGILAHPTSLPGRGGIGELGSQAYRFVDWLRQAGQSVWQILPLGPTGYGDSPYASFSAFAGNPLLISLEALNRQGLISADEWAGGDRFGDSTVDFGAVIGWKIPLLKQVYGRVVNGSQPAIMRAFEQFCVAESAWLDDYALFSALKERFGGAAWNQWDMSFRTRDDTALRQARNDLAEAIKVQQFLQYLFFAQWRELKAFANGRGVRIMGDVPIFVAFDSADVWAHPEMFFLDEQRNPTVIAGVPPDYFSPTGQRWGNPLYRWDVLDEGGYRWWIDRVRATLGMVDLLRIDHFRGFEAYWSVPADEPTAINGQWVKGPGTAVFEAIEAALGTVPIIAEDLGLITPEVEAMRDALHFPGMKVLQFAWGEDATQPYLPHNYLPNCVVYTGTHDNDTTAGWYRNATEREKTYLHAYTRIDPNHVAIELVRLAMQSVAALAIAPMQDVLELPSEARFNQPGRPAGNWGWRFREADLSAELANWLHAHSVLYGRAPSEPPVKQAG